MVIVAREFGIDPRIVRWSWRMSELSKTLNDIQNLRAWEASDEVTAPIIDSEAEKRAGLEAAQRVFSAFKRGRRPRVT